MIWSRSMLKSRAKEAFSVNYWRCVVVGLILAVLTGRAASGSSSGGSSAKRELENYLGQYASSPFGIVLFLLGIIAVVIVVFLIVFVIGTLLKIFLLNPLIVGCRKFFIDNAYDHNTHVGVIGFAFSNGYMNVVKTMFLRDLYTWLWSLLFVIPGIIKSYEYRMVPFLLAENPFMSSEEAFGRSREMMDGQKMEAFILDLSFFGWMFLTAMTGGIVGVFYYFPYKAATENELYLALNPNVEGPANEDPYANNPYANNPYADPFARNPYANQNTRSPYSDSPFSPYVNEEQNHFNPADFPGTDPNANQSSNANPENRN